MRLLFLGAGKMCASILKGWRNEAFLKNSFIFSPSGESARRLSTKFGLKAIDQLDMVIDEVDIIFVCCKPQQLKDLSLLLNCKFKDKIFISILAALPLKFQKDILGVEKLIRLMPSLPVEVNEGIVLSFSDGVRHQDLINQIKKLGLIHECTSEEEFTKLTLLTASGPGVIGYLAQSYLSAFDINDSHLSEAFIKQLLLGTGIWAKNSDLSLDDLVKNVTSKGGVTEVLNTTFKEVMGETSKKAVKLALERGNEITQILQK